MARASLGRISQTLQEHQNNANYLSKFSVEGFVKAVRDWIFDLTVNELRQADDFTIMLDEATEANTQRSELSLMARYVRDGTVYISFLDLLNLDRGDAASVFNVVETYLRENKIDIENTRFSGMDGCSTMSGEKGGVRSFFEKVSGHVVYVHCRNHRLALCFSHLITDFDVLVKFDSLLLNLFLLLKHSNVRSAIFDEVQEWFDFIKIIESCGNALVKIWYGMPKSAKSF